MIKGIAQVTLGALFGAVMLYCALQVAPAQRYIEVVTFDGRTYIAGSGDTCADAWRFARIPDMWDKVVCR